VHEINKILAIRHAETVNALGHWYHTMTVLLGQKAGRSSLIFAKLLTI